MNARERGFLLLSSHLGDPEANPLSPGQLCTLAQRAAALEIRTEDRELSVEDLLSLGYGRDAARRILGLLDREEQLQHYLRQGQKEACQPVTRVGEDYPLLLRQRLGLHSPGCLWAKGDRSLLKRSAISLVGSRDLREPNRDFAAAVGRHAAQIGAVLVSGNARGADRTAQEACLEQGGQVISIVADDLSRQPQRERVLYLSEEDYDADFSARRALSRNRCIHALGQMVFVAQAEAGRGGTWDGTVKNLRNAWSPVLCFRDGSEAAHQLEQLGAYAIGLEEIASFEIIPEREIRLF